MQSYDEVYEYVCAIIGEGAERGYAERGDTNDGDMEGGDAGGATRKWGTEPSGVEACRNHLANP